MSSRIFSLSMVAIFGWVQMFFGTAAHARNHHYPQIRYVSTAQEAMGGISSPIGDEAGNALFNNPASLARYSGYRSEPLNMNFVMNSNSLSNLSTTLGGTFSLAGLKGTMNSKAGSQFGLGVSNLSAFAWNGFAVGVLLNEYSDAVSDGTNVTYTTVSQLVPAVGYGFGLARNIIRVGYTLQWVNQASGTNLSGSSSFLSGVQKGHGLSHNMSVNLAFPFTYLPTFTFMVRNIAGLHFASGGVLPRGSNTTGAPGTEPMTVDVAFDYIFRISGATKVHTYLEFKDLSNRAWIPNWAEKTALGMDIAFSNSFSLRGGMTNPGLAIQFSGGLAYRSESSELGLAYYNQPSSFSNAPAWDTRFGLQYKLMLNQKAKRVDGDLQQVGNKR